MSYSNFKANFAYYDHLLEIDYNDGNGWIDESDLMEDFTILQFSNDYISGLTQRELELNLFVETPETKYSQKNLKVRLTLKVSTDGIAFHNEKIFEGFSLGEITQPTSEVRITCRQAEERLLLKSNSQSVDAFDDSGNGTYETDGEMMDKFFENEKSFVGGTIINEDFPLSGTWNYRPNITPGTSRNNLIQGGQREVQIDQFLKALGVLGGFDKDGVFKIKKRVWETPTATETLDGDIIYEDTYTLVNISNKLIFNSIEVSGFLFNHYFTPAINSFYLKEPENTIELNLKFNDYQKTMNNLNDFLLVNNATRSKFVDLENYVIGNYNDSLRQSVVISEDKEGSNILPDGVVLNSLSYTKTHRFGTNVYAKATNDTAFNLTPSTNPFTIEAWVYPTALNQTFGSTICARRTGNTSGFHFFLSPRGEISLDMVGASSPNNLFINANSRTVPINKWTHVAVTFEGSGTVNDFLTFYVDGIRVGSYSVNSASWTDSSSDFYIGFHPFPQMQFFGNIQDLKISNYAKLEDEIRFNSDLLQTLPDPTLKAYYKIDEGSSFALADSSGNSNNAFIYGPLNWTGTPSPVTTENNPTVFTDFANGSFNQRIKINAINKLNKRVYVQAYRQIPKSYYEFREEIKATSRNYNPSTELEIKKKYSSYYINQLAYAQELADNLLSIYSDITGFYEFEISYLPRLDIGDIVTFDTPESPAQKGVVLEITTTYNGQDNFGTSKIKIKKI